MRNQCNPRKQAQQQWRGARNGFVRPLALGFNAEIPPRFFEGDFDLPAHHKPFDIGVQHDIIATQCRGYHTFADAAHAMNSGDPNALVGCVTGHRIAQACQHIRALKVVWRRWWGVGDARAVEPLIAALCDKDYYVRDRVRYALVELGAIAVELLIAALCDERRGVRWDIAGVLGQIGDVRAVEPLIASLWDEESLVRREVATALGQLGDARVVEPLIAALCDEDEYMRSRAAEALGQLGDARAVEALLTALCDVDWLVRSNAAKALERIGTPEALDAVRKWREDQEERRR